MKETSLEKNYITWEKSILRIICTKNQKIKFSYSLTSSWKIAKKKIVVGVIDNKLNFKSHINELCKRPSQINAALSKLSNCL